MHTNYGNLQIKVTIVIDLTDQPVIQYDIPIVQNTFGGDANK